MSFFCRRPCARRTASVARTVAAFTTAAVPRSSASLTPIIPPYRCNKILTGGSRNFNSSNINRDHSRNMAPANDGHQKAVISADDTLALIRNRRTYYSLNKELPVPVARVEAIVKEALTHVPSSFNSQTNRVLALFGADHDRLWGDIVTGVLKAIVPADKWDATAAKIAGFKAAGATILFFVDKAAVLGLQERFAGTGFQSKFPTWAAESSAMLQFTNWVALEAEGLGANLQHYNPLVDDKVQAEWGLPAEWELRAQLVIGGRAGEPGTRVYRPVEEMYRSHGV